MIRNLFNWSRRRRRNSPSDKHAVKNCFLFSGVSFWNTQRVWVFRVFGPSSRDLCFQDTMLNMPFVAVDEEAATKNVCHGDDCGRIEGSQKLLHKHFSVKYRFSFQRFFRKIFDKFRVIAIGHHTKLPHHRWIHCYHLRNTILCHINSSTCRNTL